MRLPIGTVTVSDGSLCIVDFGLMPQWERGLSPPGELDVVQPSLRGMGNAVVIGGVPQGSHPVLGTRASDGDSWRFIDVVIDPDTPIAEVRVLGGVTVDMARLMVADLTHCDSWQANEAADGKADVAFWGRDADAVAAESGASRLPEGVFGWADLPVAEAEARIDQLESLRSDQRKFAVDYRPHDHAFAALALLRDSPYGTAMLPLGGGTVCCFSVAQGDGRYPVYGLHDAAGRLVGVRVDLARDGRADTKPIGLALGALQQSTAGAPNATAGPGGGGVPEPMDAGAMVGSAVAGLAGNYVAEQARRALTRRAKQYLPRFLWPLIPGQGGDVRANLQREASRRIWGAITGCGCSLAFFAVFAAGAGAVVLIIAWALMQAP
jgi:hypothetical protein